MKIEAKESTGRPEPQFVITAESEQDRLILKMFLSAREYSKDELEFVIHGETWGSNSMSFNFGWRAKNKKQANT